MHISPDQSIPTKKEIVLHSVLKIDHPRVGYTQKLVSDIKLLSPTERLRAFGILFHSFIILPCFLLTESHHTSSITHSIWSTRSFKVSDCLPGMRKRGNYVSICFHLILFKIIIISDREIF